MYAAVAEINGRIAASARECKNVLVNDVESVASWIGRRNWFDARYWDIAKQFCAAEYLPAVAENITRIVLAARRPGRQVCDPAYAGPECHTHRHRPYHDRVHEEAADS
ncbi:MAG: hypothetical protein P4L56_03045 [Candidatus Sulfopaludibacter sp.]|nr:hypothetical protein [Candidatus Sulfopaludibacter sp.]